MIKPRSLTSLSFVLPCRNEGERVGAVIEQATKVGEDYGVDYEIVVVDDASTDSTAAAVGSWIKKNSRVRLVRREKTAGYGAAVRTGLESVQKDFILLSDGDGQFHMADIEKLFSKSEGVDAMVGYRLARKHSGLRKFAATLWTAVARICFGLRVHDVNCSFKLIRRKPLEGIRLESNHLLIHAELLAKLRKQGCRIEEIGVSHHPRTGGRASAVTLGTVAASLGEFFRLFFKLR